MSRVQKFFVAFVAFAAFMALVMGVGALLTLAALWLTPTTGAFWAGVLCFFLPLTLFISAVVTFLD